MSESRTRNRKIMMGLFLIGIIPMLLAYVVFFHFPELIPSGTTNKGELIQPPLVLQDSGVETSGWLLLYPSGPSCDEVCEERLYVIRQVNKALGKDSRRVKRALLVTGDALRPKFEKLLSSRFPQMTTYFGLSATLAQNNVAVDQGFVYLMDPLGNVMMRYSAERTGKEMLADLKHLLKFSNLG
jgi:cytochrome oxidase Cu insertion factor (SCO1/SenC/PrrC family)